jgi:hypothetical protein
MPYSCALAVCATFCAHISGALIPIFGPTFPSQCIPTSHQSYGVMVIEPSVIVSATAQAKSFYQQYCSNSPRSGTGKLNSSSPQEIVRDVEHLVIHSTNDLSHRLRLKRTFTNASMYATDTENSDTSMSSRSRYPYSPVTSTSPYNSHGWTPENVYSSPPLNVCSTPTPKCSNAQTTLPSFQISHQTAHSSTCGPTCDSPHVANNRYNHRPALSYGASPWLSAIPRSVACITNSFSTATALKAPPASPLNKSSSKLRRSLRRNRDTKNVARAFESEVDMEYDGEDDSGASPSGSERSGHSGSSEASEGMEKKAAWLLMNLSVRDGVWAAEYPGTAALTANTSSDAGDRMGSGIVQPNLTVDVSLDSAPRAKRRRAISL